MKRVMVASFLWAAGAAVGPVRAGDRQVDIQRTPGHGIQPQAVLDRQGTLHLLYYRGDAKAGDLMYVRRESGKDVYSHALRVNSQEGSAIAMGTIRGGHIALGKNGRVHVAWNGSHRAQPKNPITGMPMMYARLNDAGTAFEPQRNLMTISAVLDGGGSVAADHKGNVFVAWHALGKGVDAGEDNRKVWITISNDEGRTFAAEKPAWNEDTGACGCCGMRGFADLSGNAYFVYRAAAEKINRGMYLIRSEDHGKSFTGVKMDNWKISTCPMSSEAFAEGSTGVYTAWDNDGQIFFARVQRGKAAVDLPKAVAGETGNRKHPALAVNRNGDLIVVWTEGTGWNRGGDLVWQVYDKSGKPTGEAGRRKDAIPTWSVPAVVAESNGRFTVLH